MLYKKKRSDLLRGEISSTALPALNRMNSEDLKALIEAVPAWMPDLVEQIGFLYLSSRYYDNLCDLFHQRWEKHEVTRSAASITRFLNVSGAYDISHGTFLTQLKKRYGNVDRKFNGGKSLEQQKRIKAMKHKKGEQA